MKRLGRKGRPFYRVCALDVRTRRDETDARAVLNGERIDYWLSVGAQPSERVATLIKKYGTNGTHLAEQKAAVDRLKRPSSSAS
jgi:small subunit ribosomal protein S16